MESSATEASDEISPELLKNTPSNIARLEDVIGRCKGHQKYLALTSSPSDGEEIRWYFCKVPLLANELAPSVPRTEIVGKGDFFRFGIRDSLAIEASFLQREDELLSIWWKQYAECSEGPKDRQILVHKLDKQKDISSLEGASIVEPCEVGEERVGVPVKGGLYEVDLVNRHCFPVYWSGENRRVLRGHWFACKGGLDWLPLREDISEQLEIAYHNQVWHRRTFQPCGLFAARIGLQGSTPGLNVLFTGEDDTWEAWLAVDPSGLSSLIGLHGNSIKLRRGFCASNSKKPTQDELRQQKEEEMDDYYSQVPVRHVVFMVHGIGQRLEKSNLVDDVANFRHIAESLADRHLASYQRGAQRVLFIPCQWRKGLKLSGEKAVEKITLDGVHGLRVMLSATAHDVLYYMSPIYCQDIINSVSNQLNRLYLKFLKRNPGYDGKVSIYGHSLGSVLSYDILCHQDTLSSPFPMEWFYKEHARIDDSNCDANAQSSPSCSSASTLTEDSNKSSKAERNFDLDVGVIMNDGDTRGFSKQSDSLSTSDLSVIDGCQLDQESRDNQTDAIANNEKDAAELLRQQIDSLKAKIAAMELQLNQRENGSKRYTPYIKYTKLEFKIDTFFAVGSPLGVFLALRNIRIGVGKGIEYWGDENINEEMPACRRMFNIFHPFDPVAYRIEPLVCKEYITRRPIIIPYHRGGRRLHIGIQEFTEDLATRSEVLMNHLHSLRIKVLTVCQSKTDENLEGEENAQEREDRTYGSLMMRRLTGSEEGRMDYVLQDKTFEHPYLQAIGSHTNYWRDYDTALFILKHLYSIIRDESSIPGVSSSAAAAAAAAAGGTKDGSAVNWFDQAEFVEEELPLTFFDHDASKNFSIKA